MASKKRKPQARRKRGTGSVYESPKGSGIWWAAETIEGRLTRRRAASEQGAEKKLAELQKLKEKQINVHSGTQTLEVWLNVYYQQKKRQGLKPRSDEFTRDMIERYIIPGLGGMRLDQIRAGHIQDFLNALQDEIRQSHIDETGKPRYDGARTVRAVAGILQAALTLATQRKLVPDNPYSGIILPKMRRKRIEPLNDGQLTDLLTAAASRLDCRPTYTDKRGRVKRLPAIDARLFALWACYALLGIRRGEGLGLRWAAIDWKRGTIKIDQQIQRVDGNRITTETPKTEEGVREIPLPRRLQEWLRERWDDAQAERELKGWTIDTLVFPSQAGTAIWPDNLEVMFRRLRDAAGLPDSVKLHHLRHTLSTLLDECGASEALKAGILGHAKTTVTQKYTHARLDAMRRVLQAVEDRLFGEAVGEMEETGT